jgi:hypothetical protein
MKKKKKKKIIGIAGRLSNLEYPVYADDTHYRIANSLDGDAYAHSFCIS